MLVILMMVYAKLVLVAAVEVVVVVVKVKGSLNTTQHDGHCLVRRGRLVPSMVYVMWACTSLLPLLGSGPVWERTYEALFGRPCANTAWANLLFLNNFNDPSDMVSLSLLNAVFPSSLNFSYANCC